MNVRYSGDRCLRIGLDPGCDPGPVCALIIDTGRNTGTQAEWLKFVRFVLETVRLWSP
jgi:hypothetical protein